MKRTRAFTLIELLVVIAIIGILAAIIFPVFSKAREAAYRSGDASNMNSLRMALQLYRADQGGYPPALLGYATLYIPGSGNVVPADQLHQNLYPRRVEAIKTFDPAYERSAHDIITKAVWPTQDPRPAGTAPILDLNGDGMIDATDDPAMARQQFGPNDGWVQRLNPRDPAQDVDNVGNGPGFVNAYFYRVSGFDAARVPSAMGTFSDPNDGNHRTELRYTLFWTQFGLGTGSAQDDPRQLGYTDPLESTVVTWNSYFRDYSNPGIPDQVKKDTVLFLGGAARAFDSKLLYDRSWRNLP